VHYGATHVEAQLCSNNEVALIGGGKGFVKTGTDLSAEDLQFAGWCAQRQPFLLETSCPRVFAAGDVRSGSTKRVAAGVGEGSVVVQFLHKVLAV
jgi:thioredoxin reductase (NADPH)